MQVFQHILVITNGLLETEAKLIKQAIEEHPEVRVKLSLIQTIPNIPACYFYLPSMASVKSAFEEQAQKELTVLGDLLEVSAEDRHMVSIEKNSQIERIAKLMQADMIINSVSQQPPVSHQKKSQSWFKHCFIRSVVKIPSVKLDKSLKQAIGTYISHGGIIAY